MERKGKIVTFGVGVIVLILLIAAGVIGLYFLAGGGGIEDIHFSEVEIHPDNAGVYHLTEEDYEKYPILKDIPKTIRLDTSMFSSLFIRPGYVDKETGRTIYEKYGMLRYIEHEGVVYEVVMLIS